MLKDVDLNLGWLCFCVEEKNSFILVSSGGGEISVCCREYFTFRLGNPQTCAMGEKTSV